MFDFVLVKIWKKNTIKEVVVGKVAACLCKSLIVIELKISIKQGRVVRTLIILFSVVEMW